MSRCAKIQFHLPVSFWFFNAIFCENFFNARFDMFCASCHVFCGAVAKETFGELIAAVSFAAFFHLRQPTDMSRGCMELGDLSLLVLIGLGLFLALAQFLFEIMCVVAR